MGETDQLPQTPQSDQPVSYDGILRSQRELTPENIAMAAKLVDLSMKILKSQKPDPKTRFKTAYLATSKITGTNFLNRKADPNGNRFYVKVRDFNVPSMDQTQGLVVTYTKTGPNSEQISCGQWDLPRLASLVNDEHLVCMRSKNEDWALIDELVSDLDINLRVNKKGMLINEETYRKKSNLW